MTQHTFLAVVRGLRHGCDGPVRRLLGTRRAGAAAMLRPLMASLRLLAPVVAMIGGQTGEFPLEPVFVDVYGVVDDGCRVEGAEQAKFRCDASG